MLDPSFLFSEDGLAWVEENDDVREGVVVPATFTQWLREERDLDLEALLAPEDLDAAAGRRDRLISLLGEIPDYSYVGADLTRGAEEVLGFLLAGGDDLRADEWAFLQSHSFLVSKLRHPLDAFRDAGAVIVEFGRKVGLNLLGQVIPKEKIPPVLDQKLMVKAAAKWIVVGGANVGGGTFGGVAGTVLGGGVGAVLGGAAGRYAGDRAAKAAVMAIDP
jgi:hypothetical protein